MKATATETRDGFWVELEAETVEDAATLVRMKLNGTKRISYDAYAYAKGMSGWFVMDQRKSNQTSAITRGA